MRISIILLVGVIILIDGAVASACRSYEPTAVSMPGPRTKTCSESFSKNSTEEFNRRCVALAGPLAAMRGDALVVRLDNGTRKIFDNKNGHGAIEGGFGYGLADFYPSLRIFVVCDHGADNGHCRAINGKTGRELDFGYKFPQFSPDGNWVLTVTDNEDGSSFAILDVRGKRPLTIWRSERAKTNLPEKASFVSWTDEKTIEFAGSGGQPVFLVQAADGSWGVDGKRGGC